MRNGDPSAREDEELFLLHGIQAFRDIEPAAVEFMRQIGHPHLEIFLASRVETAADEEVDKSFTQ